MKLKLKLLIITALAMLLTVPATSMAAGDFDWLKNVNLQAQADPSGFKARLGTRFQIGDAHIDAVISNVERPSDAYMIFRLGELSGKPADRILNRYRGNRHQGWGALAKSLGIKPGSSQFHALKRGDGFVGGKKGKGHPGNRGNRGGGPPGRR